MKQIKSYNPNLTDSDCRLQKGEKGKYFEIYNWRTIICFWK